MGIRYILKKYGSHLKHQKESGAALSSHVGCSSRAVFDQIMTRNGTLKFFISIVVHIVGCLLTTIPLSWFKIGNKVLDFAEEFLLVFQVQNCGFKKRWHHFNCCEGLVNTKYVLLRKWLVQGEKQEKISETYRKSTRSWNLSTMIFRVE